MKHAYVFPGQGAQAVGMGKDLYDNVPAAKELFEKANEILGFRITDIMFAGTDEELKQTPRHPTRRIPPLGDHGQGAGREARCRRRTLVGRILGAGGRRSALVRGRSEARFEARSWPCRPPARRSPARWPPFSVWTTRPWRIFCASVDGVVVAANYNCPGQLVISGAVEAVEAACEKAKAAGARRALRLPVGGAFHSPLMEPAKQELEKAIAEAPFQDARMPRLPERGRQALYRSRRRSRRT